MTRQNISAFLLAGCCAVYSYAGVTVEQCVEAARDNYPLIQKYDILNQSRQLDLSDINKSWLPQISVYAQGTAQNAVPSFPDGLSHMLEQIGTEMSGLGKLQYKIGVDFSQTIWDGGSSKASRAIAESENASRVAALDTELYAVRQRVENLFFGILLIEEQIKQAEQTKNLLERNLEKLKAMKAHGAAMQSDMDMVEAQMLTVSQQVIQAKSQAQSYRKLLGLYTGRTVEGENLVKPELETPAALTSNRPEMNLFEARIKANDARLGSMKASLMPRIGFFAQAYYGYPGFNYFKSMLNRDMSFNIMAGVKISWNIGSFYTKGNNERKLRLANNDIAADRDLFLFNTGLQIESQTAQISELRDIMKDDARIVSLRRNVRAAAESQLNNGVIDATALLTKITDENLARINSTYHEIQLLQSIYQLKYTLNR